MKTPLAVAGEDARAANQTTIVVPVRDRWSFSQQVMPHRASTRAASPGECAPRNTPGSKHRCRGTTEKTLAPVIASPEDRRENTRRLLGSTAWKWRPGENSARLQQSSLLENSTVHHLCYARGLLNSAGWLRTAALRQKAFPNRQLSRIRRPVKGIQ